MMIWTSQTGLAWLKQLGLLFSLIQVFALILYFSFVMLDRFLTHIYATVLPRISKHIACGFLGSGMGVRNKSIRM